MGAATTFQITHPFHPLCGQQVEVVRVRRGADPDLIVRLPDGCHAALAMSWTDYAAPSGLNLDPPSVAPHLLDFDGLRQIAQLIDHFRQEGRYPPADDGDKTCSLVDARYD